MKKEPLLSIITPTFNSERLLSKCLTSLENQTYKKMEIIISDGGSKDKTIDIAKRHKTKIIKNPYVSTEPGIYLGMKEAKGDLIMIIAIDNFFKDKNGIKNMVEIFNNNNVYAAFPKHASYKTDNLITKYINTFTDPFNHFVYGHSANARTFKKVYKIIEKNKSYDIYDYKSNAIMPMIALAQGFTVRRDFLSIKRNIYDDISPINKIIKKNKKIAYVHSVSIIHTTVKGLDHFIRKQRWAVENAMKDDDAHLNNRLENFTGWQKIKMYTFPLYGISIIFPLLRSIWGIIEDREAMWLLHPYLSFFAAIAMVYQIAIIKLGFKKKVSRL